MMTQTCLDLIASEGPIVVEGPFAANRLYLEALHTLMKRPVYASEATTGTAIGAALLSGIRLDVPMQRITRHVEGLEEYAGEWLAISGRP
jgi:sugar (pentulose or hexulose) kinase